MHAGVVGGIDSHSQILQAAARVNESPFAIQHGDDVRVAIDEAPHKFLFLAKAAFDFMALGDRLRLHGDVASPADYRGHLAFIENGLKPTGELADVRFILQADGNRCPDQEPRAINSGSQTLRPLQVIRLGKELTLR